MLVQLCVQHVVGGGRVRTGDTLDVPEGAVLGRDPGVDIRLDHPSISRRHARFLGSPLRIENLSVSSGLFVDSVPVTRGVRALLNDGSWVQIGAILFAIVRPAASPLDGAATEGTDATPIFMILRDGDSCAVQFDGRHLDLPAAAARAFAMLALAPTQVVAAAALQDAVGGGETAPALITAIREAVRALLEEGSLDEERLRSLIARSGSSYRLSPLGGLDRDALLQRLVRLRKGQGYTLCLPRDAVCLVEAG
ncbi:FHA domain-containing protein [Chondromyces crocatus]|uniref:FHA domain-containing protein n=1 Tax=Chondromyces crocatus TaxID=52 RepID=A0A0K1E5E1_CHOCO|nr:FHA domain-containing protein [Chondromyces crocatus]AKT36085.1 uncharacterized protein CMC5_001980 [Chondromyces crocatus]